MAGPLCAGRPHVPGVFVCVPRVGHECTTINVSCTRAQVDHKEFGRLVEQRARLQKEVRGLVKQYGPMIGAVYFNDSVSWGKEGRDPKEGSKESAGAEASPGASAS